MLLEIMTIMSSANSAELDRVFILEGWSCTFITKNNSPRNDPLGNFEFHFFSL